MNIPRRTPTRGWVSLLAALVLAAGGGNAGAAPPAQPQQAAAVAERAVAKGTVDATDSPRSLGVVVQAQRPRIVQPPRDASVQQPRVVSFSVTASAGNTPTFRWERRRPNDVAFTPIDPALEPSAATARYTTKATQVTPAGAPTPTEAATGTLYRVVVSNASGSTTSASALLTVTPQPTPPTFTLQPIDVSVQAPAAARFSIAATGGTRPLAYQWQRSNDGGATWNPITGEPSATTATYRKSPTDAGPATTPPGDDGASFRAVVTDAAGASATSRAVRLSVSAVAVPPAIISAPLDKFVTEGVSASFQVSASGTNLSYSWQRSNDNGATWSVVGANNSTYTTGPAQWAAAANGGDSGARFRVVVSNSAGSLTSSTATMTVSALGQGADVFVQFPPNGLVASNTLATASGTGYTATANLAAGTFSVRADGSAPENHRFVYAGTRRLRLLNNSGAAVTVGAGQLRASFSAAYTLRPNTPFGTAATSSVRLIVSHPAGTSIASAGHSVVIGNNGVPGETYTPDERAGGTVVIASRGMGGISGEVRMPAIVLAPGAEMTVLLSVEAFATLAETDLETVPVQLTLDLPPGVTLDSSAIVPLGAWMY